MVSPFKNSPYTQNYQKKVGVLPPPVAYNFWVEDQTGNQMVNEGIPYVFVE
jgi:hypothetical protein